MARRSDHTRTELKTMMISAAVDLVNEGGLNNLSSRKVAKATGYTSGMVFAIFGNLDGLILEVNAHTLTDMQHFLSLKLPENRSPEERIIALGLAYMEYAQVYYNRWKVLFEHHLPGKQDLPDWYRLKLLDIFQILENEIEQLQPEIAPKEIKVTASTLWGATHGICALGMSNNLDVNEVDTMEPLIQSLVHNYLTGLKTKEN